MSELIVMDPVFEIGILFHLFEIGILFHLFEIGILFHLLVEVFYVSVKGDSLITCIFDMIHSECISLSHDL